MATGSQPKGRGDVLSSLNKVIDFLNLTKDVSSNTTVKAACVSVSTLLTITRDSMINERDYVELGLFCADICKALDRGMSGKNLSDLSKSVRDAINQFMARVAEMQRKIIKRGNRNPISRLLHSRNDKEPIAAWKSDLDKILRVFNTELTLNTHTLVADLHRNVLKIREGADSQSLATQDSTPGESPPPPPKAFFGRNDLIEGIIALTERLTPIALIGAGGVGKTSVVLTVLHDHRIKQRFGDNRRFIRCDQFPASLPHFLSRLSRTIGADVENPELVHLRPFLASREIFMVLDNAESILDPHATSASEIYAVVEELSQLNNICLCITSRISALPPNFERLDIPTLSMEAARETFFRIYRHGVRSDPIDNILEQLDFHPLSITLLATVAHQNKWDTARLAREWGTRRTSMLQATHNTSLAATIELSLMSPTFQQFGPDARGLLEVVAFFPQGVDEDNTDWLFPTISSGESIFDGVCCLSLTYRSRGFITMLAPVRDYLSPKDPMSAPLLLATKERYFSRLSVDIDPGQPVFGEARWITSEDVNVEHLLDVFTSIDATSREVWNACADFMKHLSWHKPRLVILGPKIEALPDNHPSKLECLFQLSQLFQAVGNRVEGKRLLTHTLELSREENDHQVARVLIHLSRVNLDMHLYNEGIQQTKEALDIYKHLGDTVGQARCLVDLAQSLHYDGQLEAGEEAGFTAIDLLRENDDQYLTCRCHHALGDIYRSKGEAEKAVHHYKIALGIASTFNWPGLLFRINLSLAEISFSQGRFSQAHGHIERAKSDAASGNNTYSLACAMRLQGGFWYRQNRLEEAKSEALRALDTFEKLGAAADAEGARELLRKIDHDSGAD